MLIRVYSDVHWEKSVKLGMVFIPEELESDKDTVLVLAGDLHNGLSSIGIIREFAYRFKAVLIVLGNHDYYGEYYPLLPGKYKEQLKQPGLENVHLLQNEVVEIDDYAFFGSTFWTNCDMNSPLVINQSKWVMQSDWFNIKWRTYIADEEHYIFRTQMYTIERWLEEHQIAFQYLRAAANTYKNLVVITHHPGSMQAIAEEYKRYGDTNYLWASEYGDWVLDNANIKMWLSGHTHTPHNFHIGETHFVGNPIGYPGQSRSWDPIALYKLPKVT